MLEPRGSLAGRRFGNYVAFDVIGQGGMGSVYLAEHPEIGRKVAIKVLAKTHDEDMVQRFTDEARAVSRIGHPNIVDIFDFGRTEEGRLYYVMEWLDGRELRAVMNERAPMAALEVRPYVEQICAAIHAAHERGVVHRDLKPANIFVLNRTPLAIKVLDFGVAKLLDARAVESRTSPGIVIGTPMFTAPEQATADQGRICAQTDLYALGVILYWMLTGQPPFFAESNAVLLAMHVCDKPRPLRNLTPAVPEAIAALVEQCLAKEPRERPASARALAAAFGAALDELSGVEAAGYDDGPSGVMVFVPPTPIVEVATAATASAKPPASGPGFKVSFSPLAAVGSIPSAELADEVETEVEVPPRPPSSAAAPPPRALPPRREEPVDQDLVPTIPPPGADASEPAPTKPPGAADGARAPELSLGDDEDDVDTRVDVEGGEPRAEVVVRVPARVTVAERPQPLLAAQRAPQAAGKPARVATSWLPWVLVAISVAVAVAIALLK